MPVFYVNHLIRMLSKLVNFVNKNVNLKYFGTIIFFSCKVCLLELLG
jgi:hypothetical protein